MSKIAERRILVMLENIGATIKNLVDNSKSCILSKCIVEKTLRSKSTTKECFLQQVEHESYQLSRL